MGKSIIDSYNELVPTMNQFADEGKDIWAFHDRYSGYGFKLIEKKFYIEVSIFAFIDEDNQYLITMYKRKGNVFSCMDEELAHCVTTKSSKVYELVKSLL